MKRVLALMIVAICCFGMTASADTNLDEMIQRSKAALQPYIELLGSDLGDGVVNTSQEFIDNLSSIELMGKIGTISHGFSEGLSTIDIMDWISNDEASEDEFNAFVQMLNSFFHYESTCHNYEGYSTETYQWADFENTCIVFGWLGDNRINVRWHRNEEWISSMETAAPEPSPVPTPEPLAATAEASMGEANALQSAQAYLETVPFSHTALVNQLKYEGYSEEEATYAADHCGADWDAQAAKAAANYLSAMSFSRDSLIEQLEYDGYTHAQALYAIQQNGYVKDDGGELASDASEEGTSGDTADDARSTDDELIVSPEFSMFGVRFGDNISTVEQQILEGRKGTFRKAGKDEEYEAMKDYGTVWFVPEASYRLFGAEVNSVIFTCDKDMLEIYNVSKITIRYEKGEQKFEQVKGSVSDKLGEPEFVDADEERYYKWQAEGTLVTLGGISFGNDLREIESGAEQFELEFSPYEEVSGEDADSDDILPMPEQKMDGVFSMRNDIHFGDSMEEVRGKEKVNLEEETSEEGEVYLNAKDIEISTIQNSEISYYFDEQGGLKKTIMQLNSGDISQTQLDDDYAIIHSGLIRKYGEPAHSMDGDDEFIRNDELTGHGLYNVFWTTDLLAKMKGRSSNSKYAYDQWYFQDDEGIILIEQFCGFLGGNDTLAMHYVDYYRFADDQSRAQEAETQAAQAAVDSDL